MKKKTTRSQKKNPALISRFNSRIRQEYLDYDYLDKLSEKDLKWLNDFTEEENNARFNHDGKKFNTSTSSKKVIYDKNNARNRCTHSIAKRNNALIMTDSPTILRYKERKQEVGDINEMEDALIEYLDAKKLQNNS